MHSCALVCIQYISTIVMKTQPIYQPTTVSYYTVNWPGENFCGVMAALVRCRGNAY
jgi:hypothetical protein